MDANATQRIIKIRRDYNTWVADETLEDYALRFTPHSFRKWSEFRVANTAIGAVSFLALEAIGGAIALNYGFVNAFWAIIAVSILIFLTSLPIAYYAARHGLDMDLLTRGAGFGYIGSTITSLVYASFTFIFFALEAAIMALALQLWTGLPLSIGYLVCALAIIPLVTYGITLISRLQTWTQPVWLVMLVLPYACVLWQEPAAIDGLLSFAGVHGDRAGFNLLWFGAGAAVASALITQIGEQVDFLRFLPARTPQNRRRWWLALLAAGPGWIVPGAAKMLGGAFLAYLVLAHGMGPDKAVDPTQMYLLAYGYVFDDPRWALAAMTLFVVIAQVKINVTNAYAGSLAWSNFFARVTHSHPGRVVWLVFNVMIAIVLMELGVFEALEHVLAVFSHVAIAWIGALVADLIVNKRLGLSPPAIEFRRAYLYDINPTGVGSMLVSLVLSLAAFGGAFGVHAQALSPFLALAIAFVTAPLIAAATRGRYNLARQPEPLGDGSGTIACVICSNGFESADMAHCPAYGGAICSLCCTLDARCQDRCKTNSRLGEQLGAVLRRTLPAPVTPLLHTRLAHYLIALTMLAGFLAAVLGFFHYQEAATYARAGMDPEPLRGVFVKLYATLLLIGGVAAWWLVLANESRVVAQEESDRQTTLLLREIEAHRLTDAQLQKAKEVAEAANLAKSRFMTGMSHELRAPLNGILGYAQILQRAADLPPARREAIEVIHRSGRHLIGLIDGLLDISRIEAGKFRLEPVETPLEPFLDQIVRMFQPQTAVKGLRFDYHAADALPAMVQVDEKRLRQILINLLSNAVKFTDHGFVAFRVRYASDMAQFEVEDSGPGIPPADLDRIFLAFERSWAATDQADTGTGLGLTICQMLTGIMGGELTVRSHQGQGSVFTLKLFLPELRRPRRGLPVHGDIGGYVGARKRLLVVDDQPEQRRLLRDMLAPLGFDMHEAGNGADCLARIDGIAPDAVLMDISMPAMDGWATCAALRTAGHAMPVLMVSANAYEVGRDPALSGHSDFVTKPVMIDDLLAKLGRHLDLEWVVQSKVGEAVRLTPADVAHLHLPSDVAEALLELGAMGYVKGILARLDALRAQLPELAPLLDVLRDMAREFRLGDYQALLKKEMQRHAS